MIKYILFVFLLVNVLYTNAQSIQERNLIQQSSNFSQLQTVKNEISSYSQRQKLRVEEYLKSNPSIKKREIVNDVTYEIVDISPEGYPIYYQTLNKQEAQAVRANSLHTGGKLGLDINGEGIVIGVWDGGASMINHQELDGAIEIKDKQAIPISNHATHVTGTIVGKGVQDEAKGIAFKAKVYSYDWNSDLDEMIEFATQGYLVSNHSYGRLTTSNGWVQPIYLFGAYVSESYFMDLISYSSKYYQIVKSAGNDGNISKLVNPYKKGYELTTTFSNSKNVLAVGAIYNFSEYLDPSSIYPATFSSTGPTDDGRIKPNVVAPGVRVFSSYYDANSPLRKDLYARLNGTSMAAPVVSGSIALLQQHFKKLNNKFMKSATVRGILQHTAMEAGNSLGPDYKFGLGSIDVEKSAMVITNANNDNSKALLDERILNNQEVYIKEFLVNSSESPLQVSISWTDLPFSNYNATQETDPDIKYLVNDLDIVLIDGEGEEYYPWKLNGKQPSLPATNNSSNDVDNFERIDVFNPKTGKYTLVVSHKGTLQKLDNVNVQVKGESQEYTLIITAADLAWDVSEDEEEDADQKNEFSKTVIYPNPVKDILTINSEKAGQYSIYDSVGKFIFSGNLEEGENKINISTMEEGIYIIKIEGDLKKISKKFIVK